MRPKHTKPSIWLVIDNGQFGGIETHVALLAKTLQASHWQVHVVFLHPCQGQPLTQVLDAAGIGTHHFTNVWTFAKALYRQPPNLLHTHGYKPSIVCKCLRWLIGIPVISTYHSGERGKGRVYWYHCLDDWLSPLSCNIAVSRPILQRLWGQHCHLISNFIDLTSKQPKAKKCAKKALFVGRMCPEKGPDNFSKLAAKMPDWSFTMIGDGPMLDALNKPKNLSILGAQPVMPSTYQAFDLVCITSHYEGLPLTALEAMAAGTPVVSFAVGDLEQLIPNNTMGFTVPPGDLEALILAMRTFENYADDQRLAMRQMAYQTIAKRYSAKRVVNDQIIPLYQKLLGL